MATILRMQPIRLVLIFVTMFAFGSELRAATIYVNNRQGSDAFDGRSHDPVTLRSGPVETIGKALRIAGPGDTIVIANTGTPYYESVSLVGSRLSGNPLTPLEIIGNGAVIDGSSHVPADGWRQVEVDLWKLTPKRKGHYLLLLGGQPAPEHVCPRSQATLPDIPVGHWCAWKGSIYLRTMIDDDPRLEPYHIAYHTVGLTLYNVHHVRIDGLTFRHFQLDGINAHDRCYDVLLTNIYSHTNARAGITVAGTSKVVVRQCELKENRKHQLLITELAAAKIEDSELSEPPALLD